MDSPFSSTRKDDGLSSLEKAKLQQAKKIAQIEEELISEKPWHLSGEISADQRPKDSLLEEFLEYQTASKSAPIVTQEMTNTIEDLIKNLFDSVTRKVARRPGFRTKLPEISARRSELGLGEIYTKQYEEGVMGEKSKDPLSAEHASLIAMWAALSSRLDALSHESYTPRIVVPPARGAASTTTTAASEGASTSIGLSERAELRAASVEETMPVTVSTADRLAPQEVKAPMRALPSDAKLETHADRQRTRREKKAAAQQRQAAAAGRRADELRDEREQAIRVISLGGDTVDIDLINKQSLEKATQLSYTSPIGGAGGPAPTSLKGREQAQKQAALAQLERMHDKNITTTGHGVRPPSTSASLRSGVEAGLSVQAGTSGFRKGVTFLRSMERDARRSIDAVAGPSTSSAAGSRRLPLGRNPAQDEEAVFGRGWSSKMKKSSAQHRSAADFGSTEALNDGATDVAKLKAKKAQRLKI